MNRATTSDTMSKRDHERDLELDKKIEALRRKNAALMKRYQEVEEDRKKAEEEGMALQSRKGKADDLSITISKSTSDGRVVVTKSLSAASPPGKGQQEAGPDKVGDVPPQGAGRGHRKQLTVTMAGKKGKRVVSECPEKRAGAADVQSPTDDGQARRVESGKGQPPPHMTKKDTAAQDEVKRGQEHEEEHRGLLELCQTLLPVQEPEGPLASTDLNVPTSKEEQEEYLRWKKEREQIDRERVARHKNAKGQWRRAWDMDKTDHMFSDKRVPDRDWGPSTRGGRNARRGQPRTDPRGHEKRSKDKGAKNVLVMSSKAKGKDRLTGRARRWQADEEGESVQDSEATLEEFLDELDVFIDPEAAVHKDGDTKTKLGPDVANTPKEGGVSPAQDTVTQGTADSSYHRGSDKKVRFSEELIKGRHSATGSQESGGSESKALSSLKTSSPKKIQHQEHGTLQREGLKEDGGSLQDQGGRCSAPVTQNECTKKDSAPPTTLTSPPAEKACTSLQETLDQPVEAFKVNISSTNAEKLIDSGLSVLRLESGEAHPPHPTSSNKAREHGRIV